MSKVLTLFLLFAFAILTLAVGYAEAILAPNAEPISQPIALEETESISADADARDVENETVSIVLKWPHEDVLRLGLDAQNPIGADYSTAEGGSGRGGIRSGGESRLPS